MRLRAHMRPDELKQLQFIKSLPYAEMLEAHKIIERGCDVALLYFWFNLTQGNYWPLFKLIDVEKQAVYYCQRNPEFEKDIIHWFQVYETIVKERENQKT